MNTDVNKMVSEVSDVIVVNPRFVSVSPYLTGRESREFPLWDPRSQLRQDQKELLCIFHFSYHIITENKRTHGIK
jgi:hypothetical protein